jgi:hypothetical protein
MLSRRGGTVFVVAFVAAKAWHPAIWRAEIKRSWRPKLLFPHATATCDLICYERQCRPVLFVPAPPEQSNECRPIHLQPHSVRHGRTAPRPDRVFVQAHEDKLSPSANGELPQAGEGKWPPSPNGCFRHGQNANLSGGTDFKSLLPGDHARAVVWVCACVRALRNQSKAPPHSMSSGATDRVHLNKSKQKRRLQNSHPLLKPLSSESGVSSGSV